MTDQDATISINTKFINAAGDEVAAATESKQVIKAKQTIEFNQEAAIKNPQLWSCESPSLYSAVITIYNNGKLLRQTSILLASEKFPLMFAMDFS